MNDRYSTFYVRTVPTPFAPKLVAYADAACRHEVASTVVTNDHWVYDSYNRLRRAIAASYELNADYVDLEEVQS